MFTAASLAVAGVALLIARTWAASLYLVATGMLLYIASVSPGYFAQRGQRPRLLLFGLIAVMAAVCFLGVARRQRHKRPLLATACPSEKLPSAQTNHKKLKGQDTVLNSHVTIWRLCLGLLLTATLVACGSDSTELRITSGPCPSETVHLGDAVVWTNADTADHQVSADRDGRVVFDSGVLKPGDTFKHVFRDEGQHVYTCSLDGKVEGTITVKP